MKNTILILVILLSACSGKAPKDEDFVITGTRIDKSELDAVVTAEDKHAVGKISSAQMMNFIKDINGDFSRVFYIVMADIGAPIPVPLASYQSVLTSLQAANFNLVEQNDTRISLLSKSSTKDIDIKVIYHFLNGQLQSYEIE